MAVQEKLRLHWLLLLVAVTAVVPSIAHYGPDQIRLMVQNIIGRPEFIHFPHTQDCLEGTQFAVLTLISQEDYANGNTNIQLLPAPRHRNINNRYSVQPEPQDREIYMVARPDTVNEAGGCEREHAEKKLLDNLEQLLQKFERSYRPPAMVLLYTWLTPCKKCTEEILDAYNLLCEKYGEGFAFTVAYSIEGKEPSKRPMSKSAKSRQILQNRNINVIKVNISMNGGQGGGGFGASGFCDAVMDP